MLLKLILFELCCLAFCQGFETNQRHNAKEGKILPLFNIVSFPNDPCPGRTNKNGTCYTSEECSQKGGFNDGSCAQGYGVCCTFTVRCDQTSNENCTYFESSGTEAGACRVKICKCSNNICQLRLDFNSFVITGPSTTSTSVAKAIGGNIAAGGKEVSTATQCLTDTFSVTNAGGATNLPSICGTNTGEHMYVDASDLCNDLVFQLGANAVGTTSTARQWSIKVTQYSCDYNNLAPAGCTQYYFGSNMGSVKTFNFDGGTHLANQNQNICFRRERGTCKLCYSVSQTADFEISGKTAPASGLVTQSQCCGYGTDGMKTSGYDCITIPGAVKNTAKMSALVERFCGRELVTAKGMATKTICTARQPFNVRFLSDNFEFVGSMESKKPGVGVKLNYSYQSC